MRLLRQRHGNAADSWHWGRRSALGCCLGFDSGRRSLLRCAGGGALRCLFHGADQLDLRLYALDGGVLAAPGAVAGEIPARRVGLDHPVLAADGHDVAAAVGRTQGVDLGGIAVRAGHGRSGGGGGGGALGGGWRCFLRGRIGSCHLIRRDGARLHILDDAQALRSFGGLCCCVKDGCGLGGGGGGGLCGLAKQPAVWLLALSNLVHRFLQPVAPRAQVFLLLRLRAVDLVQPANLGVHLGERGFIRRLLDLLGVHPGAGFVLGAPGDAAVKVVEMPLCFDLQRSQCIPNIQPYAGLARQRKQAAPVLVLGLFQQFCGGAVVVGGVGSQSQNCALLVAVEFLKVARGVLVGSVGSACPLVEGLRSDAGLVGLIRLRLWIGGRRRFDGGHGRVFRLVLGHALG